MATLLPRNKFGSLHCTSTLRRDLGDGHALCETRNGLPCASMRVYKSPVLVTQYSVLRCMRVDLQEITANITACLEAMKKDDDYRLG
jgi:hypothetical protein